MQSITRKAARRIFGLVAAIGFSIGACATRGPSAPNAAGRGADTFVSPDDAGALDADDDRYAALESDDSEDAAVDELAEGPCPRDMVLVESGTPPAARFCIDTYEASLVEVAADGSERPFPHYLPVDGHTVRAVSQPHVYPQGFISEVQAQDACAASSKRLCAYAEWKLACMGPAQTKFPYGDARRPGACHDTGKSAVVAVFGAKAVMASRPMTSSAKRPPPKAPTPKASASRTPPRAGQQPPPRARKTPPPPQKRAHVTRGRAAQTERPRIIRPAPYLGRPLPNVAARRPAQKSQRPRSVDPGVWAHLNDPRLGQVEGALSKTGEHAECVSGFGVVDIMGNIHEWVATDPSATHGTFAGGYYLDTSQNGDGCNYKTQAHAHDYHDYSTGFRCCADAHDAADPR